jgi:hypothetical protein
MEQEHQSLNQFSMMHGLYLGLGLVLNQLIFYIMGNPFSKITGYLVYAILIAGIGFAMWTFAKLKTEEGLPYSRALGLGTLVSLFGGIIFGFFTFILYKFIEPGLFDKFLAYIEETLLQQGYKDDMVEAMLATYKKVTSPVLLAFGQIFSITFFGFIFALILAIFFKKEPANPFFGVDQEGYEED